MSERIVRALDRPRLAVLVRGCREVVIPLPPGRGHRVDVIAERGCGDAWEVCCISGSPDQGTPLIPIVMDGWTPLARVYVAAGMCVIENCHISLHQDRQAPVLPGPPCCPAPDVVPVEGIVDGAIVARLCLGCDRQLTIENERTNA